MADIKISQLGAAIAVNDSDLLPIVSNGSTLKAQASLVKGYVVGDTDLTGIGDGTPTGAISALNTAKQPKTLDTPLTIGGAQKTTVEAALGGLNSESQSLSTALTNVESDIAYINTNSTKATKSYIKGEQFILDGILRVAKTAISNGATLTLDSNYENARPIATQISGLGEIVGIDDGTLKDTVISATDTWTDLATLSLSKGVWVISANIELKPNTSVAVGGTLVFAIEPYRDQYATYVTYHNNDSGYYPHGSLTRIFNSPNGNNVKLQVRNFTGQAVTMNWSNFKAVKIANYITI